MEKKFGLALGCGGARGVAHVGFLKALEENKISLAEHLFKGEIL